MTNPFSHDPFYKRIKDALIILFAVITIWPTFKEFAFGKAEAPPRSGEMSRRVGSLEVDNAVFKANISDINKKLDRIEDFLLRGRR